MNTAARIGIYGDQFDSMTPREFNSFVDAYNKKTEDDQEQRLHEMYISALLVSRFVWAKKPPTYEQLFGRIRQAEMTDDQMLRQAEALNAMFGGTDTRKEAEEWRL